MALEDRYPGSLGQKLHLESAIYGYINASNTGEWPRILSLMKTSIDAPRNVPPRSMAKLGVSRPLFGSRGRGRPLKRRLRGNRASGPLLCPPDSIRRKGGGAEWGLRTKGYFGGPRPTLTSLVLVAGTLIALRSQVTVRRADLDTFRLPVSSRHPFEHSFCADGLSHASSIVLSRSSHLSRPPPRLVLAMASRAAIPFLVAMMLVTGVCNTLLTKYQVR